MLPVLFREEVGVRADADQVQFVSFDPVYQEPIRLYARLPIPFPDPS